MNNMLQMNKNIIMQEVYLGKMVEEKEVLGKITCKSDKRLRMSCKAIISPYIRDDFSHLEVPRDFL